MPIGKFERNFRNINGSKINERIFEKWLPTLRFSILLALAHVNQCDVSIENEQEKSKDAHKKWIYHRLEAFLSANYRVLMI